MFAKCNIDNITAIKAFILIIVLFFNIGTKLSIYINIEIGSKNNEK